MNYPEEKLSGYLMVFLASDPEGRGIKPLPTRPPKRTRRRIKKLSRGVIGNTSDFGSEEFRFET